jgi:flagellar motor switch protein FliG
MPPVSRLTGPQKAAILLIQLGKERSTRILRELREAEIEDLMTEVSRLDDVTPDAVDAVLDEFMDDITRRVAITTGGLDFARDLLEEAIGETRAREILDRVSATIMETPFEFLRRADAREILSFLGEEHPQTVALVLAHLNADQAAVVISGLPEEQQGEVALRIATMDRTSPEVINQVEGIMKRKASQLLGNNEMAVAGGLQPLIDILNRSDRATEKLILDNLERQSPQLAEEVRSRMFVFEDIVTLDDRSIQMVLREVDTKALALALKGVRDEVRDKILHNMSSRAAENLGEEIELLGPTRLKAIEESQSAIVRVIRKLEETGQIVIARGSEEFVV